MAALKFTRNKDYSDEADLNAGGRDTVDPAGLDGEMDEILAVTDDHADKLDTVIRTDGKLLDKIFFGHEFTATAITVLKALLGNSNAAINETGPWVTATNYQIGDLAESSGSSYYCLVDHTSVTFATELTANYWRLFAAAGSSGIPSGGTANDLLYYNGAAAVWGKLTAAMAPLFATLASPTLTGDMSAEKILLKSRVSFSLTGISFVAGGNTFDFNAEFMRRVVVTGNYTGACGGTNYLEGRALEIHFRNGGSGDAALLWDSDWVWMGYKPTTLPLGKTAVLSLRCAWGATAAGVVAMWSVEP